MSLSLTTTARLLILRYSHLLMFACQYLHSVGESFLELRIITQLNIGYPKHSLLGTLYENDNFCFIVNKELRFVLKSNLNEFVV